MYPSGRAIIRQLIQLKTNCTPEEADDIIDAATYAIIDASSGCGSYATSAEALEDFLGLDASYLWLFLTDQ